MILTRSCGRTVLALRTDDFAAARCVSAEQEEMTLQPLRTSRRSFFGLAGATVAATLLPKLEIAQTSATPTSGLTGHVIWPQDAEYEEARLDFNARFSRHPAAIVECSEVADVQNAILWARQEGVPLRARSGGHSYEAYSVVDDGLVIDLGGLNAITVDVAQGEAVVGSGVRLIDLYRRLWDEGVTVPAGTCPSVGVAGLTLGGGFGYLSRQYGLTCDHLLSAEVVDADGDVLQASDDQHTDLFWALRGGGGGNFGIVTSLRFQLRPVDNVALYHITWPWEDVPEVLAAWQRWAPEVDRRLGSGFGLRHPDAGIIGSSGQFNGSEDELRGLLDPMLQVGTPTLQELTTVTYMEAVERYAGAPVSHSVFKNTGAFVSKPWSAEAISLFVDHMRASPNDSNVVGFFAGGGAVADIEPSATAFAHRDALFDVQYQGYWQDDSQADAAIAWVDAIRDAMQPFTSGAYINYIDADQSDWASAYYGSNLTRLLEIRATYDPRSVFSGPQSIAVAGA